MMRDSRGTEARQGLAVAAAGSGLGAALSALLAGACCIGPVSVSLLGVGGAMAAAGLAPYRPLLLGISLTLLAAAFWLVYRPPRLTGGACAPGSGRRTKLVLWIAAAAVGASLSLNYWTA